MPDNFSQNTPPEGYTEDEMGLLRDPDATGPHAWGQTAQFQTGPVIEPEEPQVAEPSVYDDPPKKKKKALPIIIAIVVLAIVVFAAAGGVFAFNMYQSANRVKAVASEVQANASTLKDAFMDGDEEKLHASYSVISEGIHKMQDETNSSLWDFAKTMPFIGTDITNAKMLVGCAADLSDNALSPLVDNLGGVRFSDLMQDRRIDTGIIKRMRDSVVSASPVIVKNADIMSQLPHGNVSQVNEVIDKIRDPLIDASTVLKDADGFFSTILGILGDGGQLRNYVILAQTNSEIRAAGGFPGSVGTLKVQDGVLTLSEFQTVYDLKHRVEAAEFKASLHEDEIGVFGEDLSWDAAGTTQTPNFMRSGELMREFWEFGYEEHVDGVIGVDPIFLQHMLALAGGVVAEDGTEVNGDNAAAEILSGVYWRYGFDGDYGHEQEDNFFSDVANKAGDQLFSNLGGVDFDVLMDEVSKSGANHRLQVWMANPDEETFMQNLGVAGTLEDDPAKPVLGVYANDYTWSKISWYLNIWADIDEGVKNEDGTTTYHVQAHYHNNLTDEEAMAAPEYVYGSNPLKVDRGDMVDGVLIVAPAGGRIDNFEIIQGREIPEDKVLEPTTHGPLYGFDAWLGSVLIGTQQDAIVEFDMTLPPEAVERPTVRTSPLCFE